MLRPKSWKHMLLFPELQAQNEPEKDSSHVFRIASRVADDELQLKRRH